MATILFRSALSDSLRHDARDARLPRAPSAGFRNMFHAGEAPESDRWAGLGATTETEHMLAALAERMMGARPPQGAATPFPSGYTYLAQFAAHDLQFSTDEAVYPPSAVPETPLRRRRLMLETIYGEGPDADPELYDDGLDAFAPYRLRVGRFGPGVPPGQRTLPRERAHSGCSADPFTPLCAADDRNDENPIVAQLAGFFMRLHNVSMRRLTRLSDPAERFAAARRVTQATFRAILFRDLLPRLLREDVLAAYEAGRRLDADAACVDDMPVEFTHAAFRTGHALVRPDYAINAAVNGGHAVNVQYMIRHTSKRDPDAFAEGRAWPVDWDRFFGVGAQGAEPLAPHVNVFLAEAPGILSADYPKARRAHLILRDLARGMDSGPLRVEALAERVAPSFAGAPDLNRWLAFDGSHRGKAVLDWIDGDRALRPYLKWLCPEPPLFFFILLEAAASREQGGGAGLRLGALGSTLMAEPLFAARDATREKVEDHPDLPTDQAAVFGAARAPAAMPDLLRFLLSPS